MKAGRVAWVSGSVLMFAGFFALGTWQVERRAWKLDLMARVEQRVQAPAVAAPRPAQSPTQWPAVNAANDEYRRVRVSGRFLDAQQTLVQASTALGSGFWVLTPLQAADGTVVLVNRGFVPAGQRDGVARADTAPDRDDVDVTGLLRLTEPVGGFLRKNDPAGNRWYSRDVQAIAAARGLQNVAPYFVDAERGAQREPGAAPIGGLTVIAFNNNHLVYAITWYALALMVVGACWLVLRRGEDVGHD